MLERIRLYDLLIPNFPTKNFKTCLHTSLLWLISGPLEVHRPKTCIYGNGHGAITIQTAHGLYPGQAVTRYLVKISAMRLSNLEAATAL